MQDSWAIHASGGSYLDDTATPRPVAIVNGSSRPSFLTSVNVAQQPYHTASQLSSVMAAQPVPRTIDIPVEQLQQLLQQVTIGNPYNGPRMAPHVYRNASRRVEYGGNQNHVDIDRIRQGHDVRTTVSPFHNFSSRTPGSPLLLDHAAQHPQQSRPSGYCVFIL